MNTENAELIYYVCKTCGNILETVHASGVTPVCCGRTMTRLMTADTDGAAEKHIPVFFRDGSALNVRVGAEDHPMTSVHYIDWITLVTDQGTQRVCLGPGDLPLVRFFLRPNEIPLILYAHCNLHGLWVNYIEQESFFSL